jgi:hypothetical protein
MNTEKEYQEAKRRVKAIRGFYIHLVVYVLVNALLFLIDITTSSGVFWFYWPLLGWGIGLVLHAVFVFGVGYWLGPEWEEKKIKETMDQV